MSFEIPNNLIKKKYGRIIKFEIYFIKLEN